MGVHRPIIRRLLSRPRAPLVVDDQRTWRGIDLLGGALAIASIVARRNRASTLGILLPNSGAYPMTMLAGWWLGRALVPLNYLLKPDELQYVVEDCGTDVVIASRRLVEATGYEPRGVEVVYLEDQQFGGLPRPRWPKRASDDDLAALLYTSGTSGKPKGVMLTHGNLRTNIRQMTRLAHVSPDDVFLGVLPQFHSFGFTGLTLAPLTIGSKVVYTARFQPRKVIRLVEEHGATIVLAIPSMYGAMAAARSFGPEQWRTVRFAISGGEPLSQAIADRFEERFQVRLCEGFGLTETSPVTNLCLPEDYRRGSVGPPVEDLEVRIVDLDSGQPLGAEREGEIRFRGPNVMRGYYRLEEETRAAFDDEGFFRTGDIGHVDEDGRLYITGRLKEMLIIGGENVFPREIEEALNAHETVAASGVVGMRDDVRGEVPVAFVEPAEGASPDETALREWCRQRLAGYKVPREVRVIESLPRSPTGKILRRELAQLVAGA
jgi:long-chain acyl-CoA synthetase